MRTRRIVLIVVGLAVLGALFALLRRSPSRGGGPAPSASAERVIPVGAASVERRDVPVILEGIGSVAPVAMVTVKSQVDGRLDRVLFKEGQDVKRGDVLALIDPRAFAIQRQQAEAALARDNAQLQNLKLNFERFTTLRQQNLIPQQQVDDQRTQVAQAEAAVKADEAALGSARLQLDYARITSPIDGATGVRQIDPGNLIRASDTTGIVVITQLDPIAVLFTLPQDDLPRVTKHMAERKLTVDAYARDGAQKLATGELALVDNQINAQTSTIRLKAIFPNASRVLWPNAFIKARLNLTTKRDAVVVPTPAVQRGPQGTFVYVIGADGAATVRPIEVESNDSALAIIARGLEPGERVVTDGQNQLKPGSKVAPRAPEGPRSKTSAQAGPESTGPRTGDRP